MPIGLAVALGWSKPGQELQPIGSLHQNIRPPWCGMAAVFSCVSIETAGRGVEYPDDTGEDEQHNTDGCACKSNECIDERSAPQLVVPVTEIGVTQLECLSSLQCVHQIDPGMSG
ncbi:hypothetical protein B0H14DRAFT_2579694 [Mycena olivaceomarginata]|nr:hypothetical protein B0H14DRAFT_2579694 [Mycena olivaceomarginata]